MSWRGRLRISNWIGNTGRYSNWQGVRGDALTEPISVVSYGYLYNWAAVNKEVAEGTGYSLAPTGWHVPTDAEWTTLENYIDTNYNTSPNDFGVGNHLKSCRQVDSPSGGACDTSTHPRWDANATHYGRNTVGFAFLPGGLRNGSGTFSWIGYEAACWSSSESSGSNAWYRLASEYNGDFDRLNQDKIRGFSVRLLRDATVSEQALVDGDPCDDATDIDGNTYDTVKIGTQVWMVQNLATTKYRNGEDIPNVTGNTAWANDTAGARCAYGNDEDNVFATFEWL